MEMVGEQAGQCTRDLAGGRPSGAAASLCCLQSCNAYNQWCYQLQQCCKVARVTRLATNTVSRQIRSMTTALQRHVNPLRQGWLAIQYRHQQQHISSHKKAFKTAQTPDIHQHCLCSTIRKKRLACNALRWTLLLHF